MKGSDPGQPVPPAASADGTILVVDDNATSRQVLAALLRKAGYQVLTAATGQQAIQVLKQQLPDLIMLDILMPGLDGFELCNQLRAEGRTQVVPVIFLSALDAARDKVKAFACGGADYVTKPYLADEVLARVAHQLRVRRMQSALEREKAELLQANQRLIAEQRSRILGLGALSEGLTGVILDGKYWLDQIIGSGGFGVVYRATHLGLKRSVAIKIFRPPPHRDGSDALLRFQMEGISTCRVSHPNAVAVLDCGISSEGLAYLVMELLDGPTLFDELWQKRRLSLQRSLQILVPVCNVLVAAHAAGIVHRDIKPENILLHRGPGGEIVKVLDFGIAKLLSEESHLGAPALTDSNSFMGTPQYMAPERLQAAEYDGRSDVFSVAILLHEMLSGCSPFNDLHQPPLIVMFNHLHATPEPLRAHGPDMPESLERLILGALARDKEARPTAQQFRDRLLELAQPATADEPAGSPEGSRDALETHAAMRPEQLTGRTALEVARNWLSSDSLVLDYEDNSPGPEQAEPAPASRGRRQ